MPGTSRPGADSGPTSSGTGSWSGRASSSSGPPPYPPTGPRGGTVSPRRSRASVVPGRLGWRGRAERKPHRIVPEPAYSPALGPPPGRAGSAGLRPDAGPPRPPRPLRSLSGRREAARPGAPHRAGGGAPDRRGPLRGGLVEGARDRPPHAGRAGRGGAPDGAHGRALPLRGEDSLHRDLVLRFRSGRDRGDPDAARREARPRRPGRDRPRHLPRPAQRLLLPGRPGGRAGGRPRHEQRLRLQQGLGRDLGGALADRAGGVDRRDRDPLPHGRLRREGDDLGVQYQPDPETPGGGEPVGRRAPASLPLPHLGGGGPRGAREARAGTRPRPRPLPPRGRRRDGELRGAGPRPHAARRGGGLLPPDPRDHGDGDDPARLRGDRGRRAAREPDPLPPLLPREEEVLPRGRRDLLLRHGTAGLRGAPRAPPLLQPEDRDRRAEPPRPAAGRGEGERARGPLVDRPARRRGGGEARAPLPGPLRGARPPQP